MTDNLVTHEYDTGQVLGDIRATALSVVREVDCALSAPVPDSIGCNASPLPII